MKEKTMNIIATVLLYTGVFCTCIAFGYALHAITVAVQHDQIIDELKNEIKIQDAQLAHCAGVRPMAPGQR